MFQALDASGCTPAHSAAGAFEELLREGADDEGCVASSDIVDMAPLDDPSEGLAMLLASCGFDEPVSIERRGVSW